MSKSELHDWEYDIEELSGDNADKMLDIAQDIYNTAFVRGRNSMTWEQTKWIPVSERLPEDEELVLFSTKTDRVFEGKFFVDKTDLQWYAFRDKAFAYNNVVTAWMPLPKPYKQESE